MILYEQEQTHASGHRHQLHVRMTLSKGIMLGIRTHSIVREHIL